jgi:hypothetical protein
MPSSPAPEQHRGAGSSRFRSFRGASKTIQGIEAVNMIRKGQVAFVAVLATLPFASFIRYEEHL